MVTRISVLTWWKELCTFIHISQSYFCIRQPQPCLNSLFLSGWTKNRGEEHFEKKKHDQLIQCWYFFRIKEKIYRFLTLIFQNECISNQKDDQLVFDFPTFLFGGSLTHSAYASLNQAFILPDRFFRWSPFLAPGGSKHDPFSCVLLNQQLKVPVTLFTVLKRIWPSE